MQGKRKLLMIGLDGASFDLITPWIDKGELPNLASLLQEGAHGNLFSPLPLSPPAWSSIYTGKNPGKHGVFEFIRRQPGSYNYIPLNSTHRSGKDFWEILGDHNLRVGIVNAPMTYPPREVNGFLIAGFLTPSDNCEYTYPRSLKKEVQRIVPGFRISQSHEILLRFGRKRYLKQIHGTLDNIGKAVLHLFESSKYDFFAVIFSETDYVQHWFWDCFDRQKDERLRNSILDVYKHVDSIIGQLLGRIDGKTWVLVLSDHGAAPLKRFFHPNVFLNSIGALNFQRNLKTLFKLALYKIKITRTLYKFVIYNKLDLFKFLLKPITLSLSDIEWRRTLAYAFGSGQIFVNLRGREPKGIVSPEEYEKVRNMIVEKLRKIRDPQNCRPAFSRVYLKEEIFSGEYADAAPDIQIVAAPTYEVFSWASIADTVFTENIDRTGTHTVQGLYILKGVEVSKGRKPDVSLVDIAPTVLYIMGVPVESDMDGSVMTKAFGEEFLALNPIRYSAVTESRDREVQELSEDEQKLIEQRLRAMGYLG